MNLYQQFVMRPPDKARMGARLLDNPRDVAKPMTVRTSRAPYEFYDRGNVVPRGTVTQPAAYGLPANMGFAGLGRLMGLNGTDIVPGISANHVWTMEDLTASTERARNWLSEVSGGPRGLEYKPQDYGFRPIQMGTLEAARQGWQLLNEAAATGNVAAVNAVRDFGNVLATAVATMDATWDGVRFGIASRAPDIEARRTAAAKTIANTLNSIIERAQILRDIADKARAEANKAETIALQTGANVAAAAAAARAQAEAAAGEGSGVDPKLAIAGVVGLGLAVLVIRKVMKKS